LNNQIQTQVRRLLQLLIHNFWLYLDRIVTVARERTSPEKPVLWSGSLSGLAINQVDGNGNHTLSVANYPTSIRLNPGFNPFTSLFQPIQDGEWKSGQNATLGRLGDGPNYLEVSLTSFPSAITLTEVLPGDFSDSGAVEAADYVVWRKAPGTLSPFLTSYDVWRSNFGTEITSTTAIGEAAAIPESTTLYLALCGLLALMRRRVRQPCSG
jgi:hypothetical protein